MFKFAAMAIVVALSPLAAHSQDALTEKTAIEATAADKKVSGWANKAAISANAALSSSSNVVGQADGSSEAYGLNFTGSRNHGGETSEWRNELAFAGQTTKTPSMPRFVKSQDELKFTTIYLYSIPSAPKFGPYVKGSAKAPIFMGEDVRAAATTYNITEQSGATSTVTGTTLKLTDGFKPLTTRESVGGFWKAFNDGNVEIELRIGWGAEQVSADGQFAVLGTTPAGVVNVGGLRSSSQMGLEAGLSAKGKINETTSWTLSAESLTPFVNNKPAGDDRDAVRLTNVDGNAKLTSNLSSWASLSYEYKAKIQPQVIDQTQQSHMAVLNVTHNLF